jgi:hypothetical protein
MKSTTEFTGYLKANTPDDFKQLMLDAVESNKLLLKNEIMADLERKELRYFREFEGISKYDDYEFIDDEGDLLLGTGEWLLDDFTNGIKVLVSEDTDTEDVLRLLRKITAWIERDNSVITIKTNKLAKLNRLKQNLKINSLLDEDLSW